MLKYTVKSSKVMAAIEPITYFSPSPLLRYPLYGDQPMVAQKHGNEYVFVEELVDGRWDPRWKPVVSPTEFKRSHPAWS